MKHLFIIFLSTLFLSVFAQSLPTDNTERAKLARQLTRSIPMELGKIEGNMREQEFNTLYLLFSPNSFAKALDRKGGTIKEGYMLPRNLSYSDFQAWLVKAQTADEQMVVIREVIEIRKAK